MKNKKSLYILLPLTCLIWGVIAFKIYAAFQDKGEEHIAFANSIAIEKKQKKEEENYTLNLDYGDPFATSKRYKSKHNQQNTNLKTKSINKKSTKDKKEIKEQKTKLNLKYKGKIQDQYNGKESIILNINGATQILSNPYKKTKGFEIVKVWEDSIQVNTNGEIKIINK